MPQVTGSGPLMVSAVLAGFGDLLPEFFSFRAGRLGPGFKGDVSVSGPLVTSFFVRLGTPEPPMTKKVVNARC